MAKNAISSALRFLRILQKNTDRNHPMTQNDLRKLLGENAKELIGDKGTYARRIREIADSQNLDDDGNLLNKKDWRIVYPGYEKEKPGSRNGKIYYNQIFSDIEIDFFIQQIRQSDNFTYEEKQSIENRLIDNLCSKYYKYPEQPGELIIQCDTKTNDAQLLNNIAILRDNIKSGYMVEFVAADGDDKLRVSPYLMIHKDTYYWLIGNCHERKPNQGDSYRYNSYTDALTAYRIDLLSEIETAHTQPETYVHWAMTHNTMREHSYTRTNEGCRITKARYNRSIQEGLRKAVQMEKLVHGEDI